MNTQRLIIGAALASALATLAVMPAAAAEKEKCFGIAKAGQNDCANLSGSHSCAGQSKADMGADEWKYVAKGSCMSMGGVSEADAKKKMGK